MVPARVRLPLESGSSEWARRILPFLYFWAVAWVLLGFVSFVILPTRLRFFVFFLMLIPVPLLIGIALVRIVMLDDPYVEISDSAIEMVQRPVRTRVAWEDVAGVCVSLSHKAAQTFPVVILEPRAVTEPTMIRPYGSRVLIQPSAIDPLSLATSLQAIMRRVPPEAVDIRIPLLLSLAQSIANADLKARVISRNDSELRRVLDRPNQFPPSLAGPLLYFTGNFSEALELCERGDGSEPEAWALLLCRAACERDLGQAVNSAHVAEAVVYSPDYVRPVLQSELERLASRRTVQD